MNRQEMTGPDEHPDQSASSSIPSMDLDAGSASSVAPSLDQIDALAVSMLSSKSLARYRAYKEVLLAREQDEAAIFSTLTLFVWDLSESR
jgi:hypothetical protein